MIQLMLAVSGTFAAQCLSVPHSNLPPFLDYRILVVLVGPVVLPGLVRPIQKVFQSAKLQ